jgi:hypothetical protein
VLASTQAAVIVIGRAITEDEQHRMIAPATGEVHFRDGLTIVAHCPIGSLPHSPRPWSFRKLPASDRKWHSLGVHPSDHGRFEVEVVSGPDHRVHAVFLAYVHDPTNRVDKDKDRELERGDYHEAVIASDLKGQREFSWGEVGCKLNEMGKKEWLVVAYTQGPHVPTPSTEVIGRLVEHELDELEHRHGSIGPNR